MKKFVLLLSVLLTLCLNVCYAEPYNQEDVDVVKESGDVDFTNADEDNILIVCPHGMLDIEKSSNCVDYYIYIPMKNSGDYYTAFFEDGKYKETYKNFPATKYLKSYSVDEAKEYFSKTGLGEPSEINPFLLEIRENRIFSYKVICNGKSYIIPFKIARNNEYLNITNDPELEFEIGKVYTYDEFVKLERAERDVHTQYMQMQKDERYTKNHTHFKKDGETYCTWDCTDVDHALHLGKGTDEPEIIDSEKIDTKKDTEKEPDKKTDDKEDNKKDDQKDTEKEPANDTDVKKDDSEKPGEIKKPTGKSQSVYLADIAAGSKAVILFDAEKDDNDCVRILDFEKFNSISKDYPLSTYVDSNRNDSTVNDGIAVLFVGDVKKSVFLGNDGIARNCRINLTQHTYDDGNLSVYDDGFEFLYNESFKYDVELKEKLWENGEKPTSNNYDGISLFDNARGFVYPDKNSMNYWDRVYESGVMPFDIGVDDSVQTYDITREQFCQTLYNFLRKTDKGVQLAKTSNFTDTDDKRINALFNLGIVKGTGENLFSPSNNLTREEAAVIIKRASDYIGTQYSADDTKTFADESQISDWAKNDVKLLSDAGVIKGINSDGGLVFSPQGVLNRFDAVYLIERIIPLSKN